MKKIKKQNWKKRIILAIAFALIFNFSWLNVFSFGFVTDADGNFEGVVVSVEKAKVLAAETTNTETSNKETPETSSAIAGWLSWATLGISITIGKILTYLISWVVVLFKWQDFNISGVTTGWVAVRDICNMFFILILLVIAFGTILRLENYNVKKLLPKLLIIAVLINFSKTICFLFIDFSQIVMLTFVSAFATGGNFIGSLKLDQLFALQNENEKAMESWNMFGGIFLSFLFIIISFAVFVMFAVILLTRMVAFWMLIVLSPLAFLAYALPGGGYFSKWWGEFSKYLLVGPILAFFTWLSLIIISGASNVIVNMAEQPENQDVVAAATQMGSWETTSTFILAIAMLIGALKITQSLGAAGGNIGMNMVSGMKNKGMGLARKGAGLAGVGAAAVGLGAAKGAGRTALLATSQLAKQNKSDSLNKLGKFAGGWRDDLLGGRADAKRDKRLATLKKFGVGDKAMPAAKELADSKLGRYAKAGAGAVTAAGLGLAGGPVGAAIMGFVSAIHAADVSLAKTAGENKKAREKVIENNRSSALSNLRTETQSARDTRDLEIERMPLASTIAGEIDTIKQERDDKIASIDTRENRAVNRATVEGKTPGEIDGIKKMFTEERESAHSDYDKKITELNIPELAGAVDNFENAVNTANNKYNQDVNAGGEKAGFVERNWGNYHPNKVTMAATKKALRDSDDANKRVGTLAQGANVHGFEPSAFYSDSGQNNAQKKFFESLTSGSGDSVGALSKMTATLEAIRRGDIKTSEKQLKSIESLKQGIAAFEKGGGDISSLSGLSSALNSIAHGKKIEEHKEKVIG